jgi:hypothetical protein
MSTSPQPHATFSPSSHALRHKRLRHNVRGAGDQSAPRAGAQSAPPPTSVLASTPSRPRRQSCIARLGLSVWPRCFSSSPHPASHSTASPQAAFGSFVLSPSVSHFLPLTHPCSVAAGGGWQQLHSQMLRSLRSKQQRNTQQATGKPATILIQRAPVHRSRSRTRFRPLSLTAVVSHSLCLSRTRCTHGRAEGLALRPRGGSCPPPAQDLHARAQGLALRPPMQVMRGP